MLAAGRAHAKAAGPAHASKAGRAQAVLAAGRAQAVVAGQAAVHGGTNSRIRKIYPRVSFGLIGG